MIYDPSVNNKDHTNKDNHPALIRRLVLNPPYLKQFQFVIGIVRLVGAVMQMDDRVLKAGLEHIIEISNERKAMLEKLRQALISDDVDSIKAYARLLCGISNEN